MKIFACIGALGCALLTGCYNGPDKTLKKPGEGPEQYTSGPSVGPGTQAGGTTAGPQPEVAEHGSKNEPHPGESKPGPDGNRVSK